MQTGKSYNPSLILKIVTLILALDSTWTLHTPHSVNPFVDVAKSCISRDRERRKQFIPAWDDECSALYVDFLQAEPGGTEAGNIATSLTDCLDRKTKALGRNCQWHRLHPL